MTEASECASFLVLLNKTVKSLHIFYPVKSRGVLNTTRSCDLPRDQAQAVRGKLANLPLEDDKGETKVYWIPITC
eukprot:snap_masked-scaffold_7-processed-gene-9.10-mRNA-1 protein AED:1.00 eAED:1.00 QI:0/0/0/0/1/1/2/0/74